MSGFTVETESYDEEQAAWVLETSRHAPTEHEARKVAEDDVETLKYLGKTARLVQ